MPINYDGLTRNQWPGTWSPNGSHPVALNNEIRGGVHSISGDPGDQLTDISGSRLQEGMLVYVKTGYTSGAYTFDDNQWYTYKLLSGESRSTLTGVVPNNDANWSIGFSQEPSFGYIIASYIDIAGDLILEHADAFDTQHSYINESGHFVISTDTNVVSTTTYGVSLPGASTGGGASVSVGTSAPFTPVEGDQWLDSNTGALFIYAFGTWVQPSYKAATGAQTDEPAVATVSGTAPTTPEEGELWLDNTTGTLYVYVSGSWVEP